MACTRFHSVKLIRFDDLWCTRYSQATRLVRATKASVFIWDIEQDAFAVTDENDAFHTAVQSRGCVSLPQCINELRWELPGDLLERMMRSMLQESSTSWPRRLHIETHESLRDISRTTYLAVLGQLMQVYEQFYVGRQDYDIAFNAEPLRLVLNRKYLPLPRLSNQSSSWSSSF